jgi:hypothetical protein
MMMRGAAHGRVHLRLSVSLRQVPPFSRCDAIHGPKHFMHHHIRAHALCSSILPIHPRRPSAGLSAASCSTQLSEADVSWLHLWPKSHDGLI